jgi:hypothetical protein
MSDEEDNTTAVVNPEEVVAENNNEPMDSYKGEKNENGEMHGFGVYTYSSGDVYTGTFANDMMDGKGKFTCENTDEYIGEFKEDMKHGEGKYCWNDGEVYDGIWKEDSMDGEGQMTYANGDSYVGSFAENRRHGMGEMVYKESSNVYKGMPMCCMDLFCMTITAIIITSIISPYSSTYTNLFMYTAHDMLCQYCTHLLQVNGSTANATELDTSHMPKKVTRMTASGLQAWLQEQAKRSMPMEMCMKVTSLMVRNMGKAL